MHVLMHEEPRGPVEGEAVKRVRHEVRDAAYTAAFTGAASVAGALALLALVTLLSKAAG